MLPNADDLSWTVPQRGSIDVARSALVRAAGDAEPVIVAEELRVAGDALDALSGRRNVEQMLDRLFQRFCVGK